MHRGVHKQVLQLFWEQLATIEINKAVFRMFSLHTTQFPWQLRIIFFSLSKSLKIIFLEQKLNKGEITSNLFLANQIVEKQ
jgi:hypothetical protein